ncbi:MAG: PAS domain-containing sensor histidine kinase [Synechococcales bacterium]|nr:PAS domain-containing sensor histidine kinase [Synechococcales bacterium]
MKDFAQALQELSAHQRYLEQQLDRTNDPDLISQSIEELQIALEEMQSINEDLMATRKLVEAERHRYQSWFELAPDAYIVTTSYGSILEANQAAADLLGCYAARLRSKPITTFVALSQRLRFRQFMLQVEQSPGVVHEQKFLLKSAQKSTLRVMTRVMAVVDREDASVTLRWAIHDVGKQVTVERELRRSVQFSQSLQRLSQLAQKAPDADQILSILVEEVADVLGVGCDAGLFEESGERQMRYVCCPPASRALSYQSYFGSNAAAPDSMLGGEALQFCNLLKDALTPSLQSQVALFVCSLGDTDGILGDLWIFMPQADHLSESETNYVQQAANQCAIAIRNARLHQQVHTQVQELQELDRLKDQFLSTISHELRTPITNIRLAVETLKRNPSPERQQRYLEILQAECDREIDLVNDLLDLQQLEAGTYSAFTDILTLNSWLAQLEEQWQEKCRHRQQRLQFEYPIGAGAIACDPISLSRIVKEFLKNAYKYTPAEGRVILTAEVDTARPAQPEWLHALGFSHSPSSNATLRLSVRNTAHIPDEHLSSLFDKFYRVPKCDPWAHGGTGLGLTLVKRLAEFLGGTVAADSNNGWVTFSLLLPVWVTDAE